jgi:hypothetical protein
VVFSRAPAPLVADARGQPVRDVLRSVAVLAVIKLIVTWWKRLWFAEGFREGYGLGEQVGRWKAAEVARQAVGWLKAPNTPCGCGKGIAERIERGE